MKTRRLNYISRINNKWLRRSLIIISFPIMCILNVAMVIPALIIWGWKNNEELISSSKLRWNIMKED